ncbi:MAG: restriction endonuclease subunit S, partial [Selenomonadaceae bacterium]|nr:restriction endonuclease subunit S [Selenomonadaceae bacterium]
YQLCAFDWEPHITQTALPSIVASEIVSCKFAFPPLDEQKEIAAYLDEKTAAIDSLVAKKNRLVSELESLKKSLIFEYVTGKKEVPK